MNFNKKIDLKPFLPKRYTAEISTSEPITDVRQSVQTYIWEKYGWKAVAFVLVLLAIGGALSWYLQDWRGFILPLLIIVGIGGYIDKKMRRAFWRAFAKKRGWQYLEEGDPSKESALAFKKGHSRQMLNVITGDVETGPVRIFEYHFATGAGRNRQDYDFVVFEFTFAGHFPHIYLDSLGNSDSYLAGEQLSLPPEFEKQFKLFAPPKYEVEALEIFTPDTLTYLLESKLKNDVELVDQKLIIFYSGNANKLATINAEFEGAFDLAKHLKKKLDRIKFSQIGDISPQLVPKKSRLSFY